MLTFVIEALRLIIYLVGLTAPAMKYTNETARNLSLLQQAFKVHFVSKVTRIHFIDGNNIGLICNSMVCCSI